MWNISTAKSCLLLDKQRRLVGFDMDVDFLQKSMPSLMERYDSQRLHDRFYMTDENQQKDLARKYLAAVESGRLKKWSESLCAPACLPTIPTFHAHVVCYLCILHQDYNLFGVALHLVYTCQLHA